MGYTKGIEWSDELIREKILEVVNGMELDRMPSRKEVEAFYGDSCLTNAISRRGGWYQLASDLDLPIKQSETYFGKSHEKQVRDILISMGHEVRQMPQNFPYDLLVDDCVKIDVKVSRLYEGAAGNFYSFNLEKPFCTCDIYVLRLMQKSGTISSLIVPSKFVPTNTQISVGEKNSKYHRFLEKWDFINDYIAFFDSVC